MNRLEFFRGLPYFADLPDETILDLCGAAPERILAPAEELVREGVPAAAMYLVVDGKFEVVRRSGGREVVVGHLGEREPVGEISLLQDAAPTATVRALTDATVIEISRDVLGRILANPAAAAAMVRTVVSRLRATESRLRESEKLAALGRVTTGLMHELNNPAAAVQRAVADLGEGLAAQQDVAARLVGVTAAPAGPPPGDPLARGDLVEAVTRWLDDHDVGDAHEIAPDLVDAGWTPASLDRLAGETDADNALADLVRWMALLQATRERATDARLAAARISELVATVKRTTYPDTAPVQDVDVNEALRDTLRLMRHAIDGDVEVVEDLDPDLPTVEGYGAELQQVWTNLVDNALDAIGGSGTLRLRTVADGGRAVVDVTDDGPGIPEDVRPHIFEPFFTTKPFGEGTGIGLDTVYEIVRRHGGDVTVTSRPGETTFRVTLPYVMSRQEGARA